VCTRKSILNSIALFRDASGELLRAPRTVATRVGSTRKQEAASPALTRLTACTTEQNPLLNFKGTQMHKPLTEGEKRDFADSDLQTDKGFNAWRDLLDAKRLALFPADPTCFICKQPINHIGDCDVVEPAKGAEYLTHRTGICFMGSLKHLLSGVRQPTAYRRVV
jgi:hypothetical protein